MKITLLQVDSNTTFSEYEKYLRYAHPERLEKIQSLKFDSDKTMSLLSHLLARYKISEELKIPFDNVKFLYNEYGKPYIKNNPVYFSVSHSKNLIAFVMHSSPIGIDIQKTTDHVSPAVRFFTEKEQDYIHGDPSKFFEIWTKKEAYVKMLGTGLSQSFKTFDVLSDNFKTLFHTKCFDNYYLTICTENVNTFNIETEHV